MPTKLRTTPIRFQKANFSGTRIALFDPGGPKVIFEFGTIDGLRIEQFRLEALNYIRKVGRRVKRAFTQTVATYIRKPTFGIKTIAARDTDWGVEIGTNDLNYFRVNEGTKKGPRPDRSGGPRLFRTRAGGTGIRRRFVAFRSEYLPKTEPWKGGRFIVRSGRRSGPWVRVGQVMTGIRPRNFVGYAASEGGKIIDLTVNKFMEDALQKLIAKGAGNLKFRSGVEVEGLGKITSIER